MPDYRRLRDHMVDAHIKRRGVRDEHVLMAMRGVPRECFVAEGLARFAYEDVPLPIEEGQTISQPYIVAVMIEAAEVRPGDRVLEVGAGSGYAAAVIAQIAERVYAIERHEALAASAEQRITALGYDNVEVIIGDGSRGLSERAPFDAILVAARGPVVRDTLKEQLVIGGRLVMPVGGEDTQRLCKVIRRTETSYEESDLGDVRFVPLIEGLG